MSEPQPQAHRVDGRLIYAIGDVHGRYDLLTDLLGQIATDIAARAAGRRPLLIFCGDYIDRGPDTAKVMEALLWLQADGRVEVRLLMGNHEEAFLQALTNPKASQRWLQVGGRATLRSYDVGVPDDLDDAAACHRACTSLAEGMPPSHLAVLRTLEMMVVVGDYAFVHAGVRAGVALGDQTPRDLLWIRDDFLSETRRFEKRIVHGHSWSTAEPEVLPNRINIDTGAFKTGVLTAVRLEDDGLAFLQTGGAMAGAATPTAA